MLGNVVAQARYDQNGCGSLQFIHFNTYAFSMTRLALSPEKLFVVLTLKSAYLRRFSLDVSDFSFDDKFAARATARPLVTKLDRCAPGHCNQGVDADGGCQRCLPGHNRRQTIADFKNCSIDQVLDIVAPLASITNRLRKDFRMTKLVRAAVLTNYLEVTST